MVLETKLNFSLHLKNVQNEIKQQDFFANFRARPHLDYEYIVYDRAWYTLFRQNIESIKRDAVLATAGAVRETSSEKVSQKLGF